MLRRQIKEHTERQRFWLAQLPSVHISCIIVSITILEWPLHFKNRVNVVLLWIDMHVVQHFNEAAHTLRANGLSVVEISSSDVEARSGCRITEKSSNTSGRGESNCLCARTLFANTARKADGRHKNRQKKLVCPFEAKMTLSYTQRAMNKRQALQDSERKYGVIMQQGKKMSKKGSRRKKVGSLLHQTYEILTMIKTSAAKLHFTNIFFMDIEESRNLRTFQSS